MSPAPALTPPPSPGERRSPTTPARRLLVPHEHGAYGQLAMPLVTALAVGRMGLGSGALALAAVAVFVAHEPLLVALGQRGRRALEQDGARARRLLAMLATLAAVLGVGGLALAPPSARWAALVPTALAGIVTTLVWHKLEKTTLGEIAVAATLSSCGLSVALAGGARPPVAIACWITWIVGFSVATLAVRTMLARAKSKGARNPGPAAASLTVAMVVLGFLLATRAVIPVAAPLALVPMATLSLALSLFHVSPKRLREVGWAMVGASAMTMVVLVAGMR